MSSCVNSTKILQHQILNVAVTDIAMIFRQNFPYYPVLIVCIAACLFLPFLGGVHLFDWDEINFAESAREMLLTKNYRRVQIDFEPFWEKPPLFFWLQTLAMSVFGVGEYAARLPNAVFGILTMLSVYHIGKKHYDQTLGVLWAMCYAGSILPHFYFKSGIIDPVFNFFIFQGIYWLYRTVAILQQKSSNNSNLTTNNLPFLQYQYAALAGLFVGLAILTKGPVGLLIPLLCYIVYAIIQKFQGIFEWKTVLLFAIVVFILCMAWFGLDLLENGIWFLSTFIAYQVELFTQPVAGHDQPFYYHFVVIFFGCFPVSIIALPYIFPKKLLPYKTDKGLKWGTETQNFATEDKKTEVEPLENWLFIMFWVVMIVFSLSTTKIVHYSSLTYYPLTFIAALRLWKLINFYDKWNQIDSILLSFVGTVVALAFILFPFIGMNTQAIAPFIKDDFAVANLKAVVQWSWYESLIGFLYLIAIYIAVWLFRKTKFQQAINVLLPATTVFLWIAMAWAVPKIERYTQGSVIDFYKTLQGKDVYIQVLGFKSYAHYFYPRIEPTTEKRKRDSEWLMKGEIDKPVYFITKVVSQKELQELRLLPDVREVKELNGYVVFFRDVRK